MLSKLSNVVFTRYFASLSAAKKVAYLAVFIALGVVVNSFIEISTPSTKITFTYFVCFLAGFLLGPLPGFLVGFLGDAIGFLLVPQDVYWFFGLTLGLFGMIAGFVRKIPLRGRAGVFGKAVIALVINYLFITCFVNSLVNYSYLYIFLPHVVEGKTFWIYLSGRLVTQTIVYAVNVAAVAVVLSVFVTTNLFGLFRDELYARTGEAVGHRPEVKTS